jgi:hypothetical protein
MVDKATLLRCFCLASMLSLNMGEADAAERRISGTIVAVDCGDATNFIVRQNDGERLSGVCYEKWCEGLCGEQAVSAKRRMIGREISMSIRVVNTEEASSGSLANEFYHMTLK